MFEIGYLNHYGINYQSAEVRTRSFIIFGVVVLYLGFIFLTNENLFWRFIKYKPSTQRGWLRYIQREFKIFTLFFLTVLPFAFYYGKIKPLGIAVMVYLVGDIIGDVLFEGRGKSIKTRLDSLQDGSSNRSQIRRHNLVLACMVVAVGIGISLAAGKEFARMEDTYKVIGTDRAVVREYDDKIIIAQFDTRTNRLTGKYQYINSGEDIIFTVKNLNLNN
jgi:hypothetical protein